MQRRGGKRIRMDEPPPEYENPMTPMETEGGYGFAQTRFALVLLINCVT